MLHIKFKINYFALIAMLMINPVWASGGGGEGGEGGGEAKKVEAVPAHIKEYTEKMTKLTTLETRIHDANKSFEHLVEEKGKTQDRKHKHALNEQMKEVVTQRNKDVVEYNKLKAEIQYKYPDKGAAVEQQFVTQKPKNMDEMQNQSGLEELLSRAKRVVDRKFAPFVGSKGKDGVTAPPAPKEEEAKPQRLKLVK